VKRWVFWQGFDDVLEVFAGSGELEQGVFVVNMGCDGEPHISWEVHGGF
tara:strand:+ start:522 stop:668 length:147 start_codon:yes stop_codon:yes gene_type:complete